MQEEVENRTVNLAVSTTKFTARTFARAVRWYLIRRGQKRMRSKAEHPFKTGKQTVAQLLKPGLPTDRVELVDGSAKDFCRIAKQFGVDYAIRKDPTKDPPRYVVFFKAKDQEVLNQVVDEYSRLTDHKESVRKQLNEEKEKVKQESKEKSKSLFKKHKRRKERTEGR